MIGELAKRTFFLDSSFVAQFKGKQPAWGPLGWVTYLEHYSRNINSHKEAYWETLVRVVEGTISIQKNHCTMYGLPWDDAKAQRMGQRMFLAMWLFKFLPPGRGLWAMGTDHIINDGGAALNNCGFVSTIEFAQDPAKPFCFLMEMMMLGVGVGFDTQGADTVKVNQPSTRLKVKHSIPDTRKGWVQSVELILEAYLGSMRVLPEFDYSLIRKKGEPLKTFGGTASGPAPLIALHCELIDLLTSRIDKQLSSVDIVDIMNLIGVCVNAGNIRRGAEIALGSITDIEFLTMKTRDKLTNKRHRGLSNNSVVVKEGTDYTDLAAMTADNGEPGYFWIENAQKYGRMKDPANWKDRRIVGTNPCSEQSLESYELCCLVETFPSRHETLAEYMDTLKLAYLYAKTVTLVPTGWKEINAVTLRNRRIGCSQSGITKAFTRHGRREILHWSDEGYEFIEGLDKQYSAWLCIPESIKKTSVKPSGTVSMLPGETSGIHYPHSKFYLRRMRFAKDDPKVLLLERAGYRVEPDHMLKDSTVVVAFPVKEGWFERDKSQVSMWEQLENAAAYQYYWSDNQVSATITHTKDEAKDIGRALELYEHRLKSISFLPIDDHGYVQAPFEAITEDQYNEYNQAIRPIEEVLDSQHHYDAKSVGYCDSESCQRPL